MDIVITVKSLVITVYPAATFLSRPGTLILETSSVGILTLGTSSVGTITLTEGVL